MLTTLVWLFLTNCCVQHYVASIIYYCDLTDTQWLQASLTIREGGLGETQVASLALPALLASAARPVATIRQEEAVASLFLFV